MRTLALLVLCACTDSVTTLRYQASTTSSVLVDVGDHGRSILQRPQRGEAVAATLADGFPVWIVRHVEGEPGTFLVRKQGATFQIIGATFRGMCGGSW